MDALRGGADGSGRRDVECFNVRLIDGTFLKPRGELSENGGQFIGKITYSIFRDKIVTATEGTA